jgi:hypothetical protein
VKPAREVTSANTQNKSKTVRNRPNGGIRGGVIRGTMSDAAVVVTLIPNGEDDPLGATVAGEAVQTAKEGAPVHVSATVPANPPSGEICRLYVAVLPAVTDADVEPLDAAAMEKSVPLPARDTERGLPPSVVMI